MSPRIAQNSHEILNPNIVQKPELDMVLESSRVSDALKTDRNKDKGNRQIFEMYIR